MRSLRPCSDSSATPSFPSPACISQDCCYSALSLRWATAHPHRGTLGSSLRSPAEGEGHEGFPPPPEKAHSPPPVCNPRARLAHLSWGTQVAFQRLQKRPQEALLQATCAECCTIFSLKQCITDSYNLQFSKVAVNYTFHCKTTENVCNYLSNDEGRGGRWPEES